MRNPSFGLPLSSVLVFMFRIALIQSVSDFAANQFTLVGPFASGTSSTAIAFPTSYSTTLYGQNMVLGGFKMSYNLHILLNASVATPISASGATITVITSTDISLVSLYIYMLFIRSDSLWVFMQDSNYLNNATNSYSTYITPFAGKNIPFCISLPPSLYYYSLFKGFESNTTSGQNLNANLTNMLALPTSAWWGSGAGSDFPSFVIRDTTQFVMAQYVNIYINYNHTSYVNIGYYVDTLSLNASANILLTTTPTNFNIPSSSAFASGYDGMCLIGLSSMILGSGGSGFTRSLLFNAKTNPISSIENAVFQSGGFYETFLVNYTILCFAEISCPAGLTVNQVTLQCEPCAISNCIECYNLTTCKTCTGSYIWNGFTCIIDCLTLSHGSCLTCPFYLQCQTCSNDSYFLVPAACGQTCRYCGSYIANCYRCTNYTYCIQCVSSSFFVSMDHLICLTCSQTIPFCNTCTTNILLGQFNCTSCMNSSYFVDPLNLCTRCSDRIPHCVSCNSVPHCLACQSNYLVDPKNFTCHPCSFISPYCVRCAGNRCYQCSGGLVARAGTCICITGVPFNGRCHSIVGCTQYNVSGSVLVCNQCNTTLLFEQSPVNNTCICSQGVQVNELCSNLLCSAPYFNGTSFVCASCDVTAGFQSQPSSLTGECQCSQYYNLTINNTCVDICGDGVMMSKQVSYCDDGNTQSGDGCSSNCTVESHYKCTNTDAYSPSVCTYAGLQLQIKLDKIERILGTNAGSFSFDIYPAFSSISKLNLSQAISFDCPLAQYSIANISYSFGTLLILANYTQDMEGLACNLTLTLNTTFIKYSSVSLAFNAIGRNIPLTISHNLDSNNTIEFIFKILSYMSLALFVLSLSHKMIGAELLLCCQMVYLSNCFNEKSTMIMNTVKSFQMVTGDWSFFHSDSDQELLQPFSNRVDIGKRFFQTNFLVLSVLLGFSLVFVLLMICKAFFQKIKQQNSSKNTETKKIDIAIKGIYSFLIFPIAIGFMLVLLVSTYFSNLRIQDIQSKEICPQQVDSLTFILAQMLFGFVSFAEFRVFIQKKSDTQEASMYGLQNCQRWYIPLYILRVFVMSVLIQIGISIGYKILLPCIFGIQTVYTVIIIVKRPYAKVIDMIGLLSCQLTSLYAITISFLKLFYLPTQTYQILIVYSLQGLLAISLSLATTRILIHNWQFLSSVFKRLLESLKKDTKEKQTQVVDQPTAEVKKQQPEETDKKGSNIYSLAGQGLVKPKSAFALKKRPKSSKLTDFQCQEKNSEKLNLNLNQTENEDGEILNIKKKLKQSLIEHKRKKNP